MKVSEKLIKAAIKIARKHPFSALQFEEGEKVKLDRGFLNKIHGCWVPCVVYLKKKEMPNE